MYSGCRAISCYFISVPRCHVRNILAFHVCGGLDVSKICMESKFQAYIRVRRSGWSYVPLLTLLRILRRGKGKLMVPIVITLTFLVYLLA